MRNKSLRVTLLALLCTWPAALLHAQTGAWPNKPIRYIIPYGAGATLDTLARAHAAHLTERFGQSVVVENRPGASQAIAIEAVAKAPPDGNSLLMGTQSGLIFLTASRKSLPYDPFKDVASVTLLTQVPFTLTVHPSVPANSIQELVAYAKANPGKLFYGSIGPGSGHHLVTELFATRAGIQLVHVPFKTTPQVDAALVANEVQVLFEGPAINPLVKSGKARGLVTSTLQRSRGMPDLPTLHETILPGFDVAPWFGLSVTGGTPRPIIDRLNRESVEWLRMSATQDKLNGIGFEVVTSTPEQMAERLRTELPVWTKVMRAAGIEAE